MAEKLNWSTPVLLTEKASFILEAEKNTTMKAELGVAD